MQSGPEGELVEGGSPAERAAQEDAAMRAGFDYIREKQANWGNPPSEPRLSSVPALAGVGATGEPTSGEIGVMNAVADIKVAGEGSDGDVPPVLPVQDDAKRVKGYTGEQPADSEAEDLGVIEEEKVGPVQQPGITTANVQPTQEQQPPLLQSVADLVTAGDLVPLDPHADQVTFASEPTEQKAPANRFMLPGGETAGADITAASSPTRPVDKESGLPLLSLNEIKTDYASREYILGAGSSAVARLAQVDAPGFDPNIWYVLKRPGGFGNADEMRIQAKIISYLMKKGVKSAVKLAGLPAESETEAFLLEELVVGYTPPDGQGYLDMENKKDDQLRVPTAEELDVRYKHVSRLYEQANMYLPSDGSSIPQTDQERVQRAAWSWGLLVAMAEIHRAGVVLTDAKPYDAILTDEGIVKIIDFGNGGIKDGSASLTVYDEQRDINLIFAMIAAKSFGLPFVSLFGVPTTTPARTEVDKWIENIRSKVSDATFLEVAEKMVSSMKYEGKPFQNGEELMEALRPLFIKLGVDRAKTEKLPEVVNNIASPAEPEQPSLDKPEVLNTVDESAPVIAETDEEKRVSELKLWNEYMKLRAFIEKVELKGRIGFTELKDYIKAYHSKEIKGPFRRGTQVDNIVSRLITADIPGWINGAGLLPDSFQVQRLEEIFKGPINLNIMMKTADLAISNEREAAFRMHANKIASETQLPEEPEEVRTQATNLEPEMSEEDKFVRRVVEEKITADDTLFEEFKRLAMENDLDYEYMDNMLLAYITNPLNSRADKDRVREYRKQLQEDAQGEVAAAAIASHLEPEVPVEPQLSNEERERKMERVRKIPDELRTLAEVDPKRGELISEALRLFDSLEFSPRASEAENIMGRLNGPEFDEFTRAWGKIIKAKLGGG